MSWQKWQPILFKEMERMLSKSPKVSPIHKADHILRVWRKSKKLCETLGGDLEVMVAAVMLHDLGRHYGLEIHGEKSAELAKPILERLNFPKEKISPVLEAITQQDYAVPSKKRVLLESKILYDADKIDAFGVVGIYRHVLFVNAGRMTLQDAIPKLDERYNGLTLPESKKLAKKDYLLVRNFFEKLNEELKV